MSSSASPSTAVHSLPPRQSPRHAPVAPVVARTTPAKRLGTTRKSPGRREAHTGLKRRLAQRLDHHACELPKSCDFCHLNTNSFVRSDVINVYKQLSKCGPRPAASAAAGNMLATQILRSPPVSWVRKCRSRGLTNPLGRLRPRPGCSHAELSGPRSSADRLHPHGKRVTEDSHVLDALTKCCIEDLPSSLSESFAFTTEILKFQYFVVWPNPF